MTLQKYIEQKLDQKPVPVIYKDSSWHEEVNGKIIEKRRGNWLVVPDDPNWLEDGLKYDCLDVNDPRQICLIKDDSMGNYLLERAQKGGDR